MSKSYQEKLEAMQEGGRISAGVLKAVLSIAKPGISTLELDKYAEDRILSAGAKPAFKGFSGYKHSICANLNDGLVHGIPKVDEILREGDILKVDLGVKHRGFITDCAWTTSVDANDSKVDFLETGKLALREAIKLAMCGNHISDISRAIQKEVEKSGYSAVRQLTGHGVGISLHEDPTIPCYYDENYPDSYVRIESGMALAIEVMYTEGSFWLKTDKDGWTMRTKDGKISALFEETVFVTEDGPVILTKIDE